MPPKRSITTTGSSNGSGRASRPSKRYRRALDIGAPTQADASARVVQAQLLAERAGGGASYLATRSEHAGVRSLKELSLQVAGSALYQSIRLNPREQGSSAPASASSVGWDPDRDPARVAETQHLREFIKTLPVEVANRLLRLVLDQTTEASFDAPSDPGVSVLAVAALFFHPNTTRLSLSGMSAPAILIARIPQCSALTDLDLSMHPSLGDKPLAKVLAQLPTLERINLRSCTKVGDASMVALSKATEDRLKIANLSLTAVTVKGLTSLLARCKNLEVLKLASVAALNEKNVSKLVTEATDAALGWRHIPLSRLHTLKLRSTDVNDAALGRLLSLCSSTLLHLDISYTQLKTLDFVSSALHTLSAWRLEKLVASGLPLAPASLEGFFRPLSERPEAERRRFRTLKLGNIPASSTKAPGLVDSVLAKLMPFLEKLEGLESVSLYQNWGIGKLEQPLSRFIEHLDLTLPVESYHLESLLPPLDDDPDALAAYEPPRLRSLVLDSSRITDAAAGPISACRDLRALHVAETRISTQFLSTVLSACPHLSTLNLTSCRGVPVTQRRTFFDAWDRGEVVVTP
ncbi:hypothetical protein Rhopal_002543-T1 [Rhodotorula paludigena]|uniref:RNI-like protein n=1 Tax=Rhodotorula paludigena TaxID=86838 RepID=A0AAV5GAV5_9BASI|nr:hypothetical protein Rhopal_002543-T1 [Rhodotorula paludigena]